MTDEIIEEEPIQTGCITITILDTDEHPIKNVLIGLNDGTNTYTGRTDYTGEVTIENVIYGTYDLLITRTGYHNIMEDDFVVDEQTVTASYTMTHVDPNPDIIEVDLDEVYSFHITEGTPGEYGIAVSVINWLQGNLAGLLDDYNTGLFGKVNIGFNDSTLKSFGKKPVCDVYINNVEYEGDFGSHIPTKVHTIVLFYLKGANNHTYLKGCELHDYLLSKFINEESFKRNTDTVRDTIIDNTEIRNQPIGKTYGVMGAFELTHLLYQM